MVNPNGQNRRTFTKLLVSALSHLYSGEDTASFLKDFLPELLELFQITGVLWWEFDQRGQSLSLESFAGPFDIEDEDLMISATEGFTGAIMRSRTPQVLEGSALSDDLPEPFVSHSEVETALGVRISLEDQPYGVLIALFPSGASLALQQMETFQLLASAMERAIRIQHLRKVLETQFQRLKLLQALSQILQSDDPIDERFQKCIVSLTSAFDANFGHILLADNERKVLRFLACSGENLNDLRNREIEPGYGIVGKVFQKGQPILLRDVTEDPDYLEAHPGVRSELAVPIEAEGEVMGVINLESIKTEAFDEDDLRMASITASQTGAILRHSLAYDSAMARLMELDLLNRVTWAITTTDDVDELLQTIVKEIHSTLDVTTVSILLIGTDGIGMEAGAAAGNYTEEISELKLRVGKGVTGEVALKGTTQYVPDVTRDERYIPVDPSIRCELAVPLKSKGSVLGVLNLESSTINAFNENDRRVVDIVAVQTAQIMTKALLYEELAMMAVTDGLTGLFNHRQFFVRLKAEFRRAVRYAYPLSLIMVDIDYFKEFNDTYGHLKGDSILRRISSIIVKTMRETDVVARYGGEEFATILPLCHESTAMEVAERLRENIEEEGMGRDLGSKPITISVGICSAPKDASSYQELVKRSDDAMYYSKRQGRNRCTLWRPDLEKETATD